MTTPLLDGSPVPTNISTGMESHSERQTAHAVVLSCESAAAILVVPASTLRCCSACVWQRRLDRSGVGN